MTFEQIAETFNLLASKQPDLVVMDWTGDNEWGIDMTSFDLTPQEIRMLAEMKQWGLGSSYEFDEDDEEMQAWINPQDHTDEEIVEVFNRYQSIFKYA
jgi:hypothetical protein